MAERPKTSHKARSRVQPVVSDEVQLPDEVSFPLVPTHDLNQFRDSDNGHKDELDDLEPSNKADESADGSTKDLMAAFSDKVQNWEVKQSKPIDLFKKVKRPWSAVGKVQPAIEMTERPGTAPTSVTKPKPTSEKTIEEETSFINPVAQDSPIERIQSPKAWPEPEQDVKVPVPDGIDFTNTAAIEREKIDPTTDVIEEITRAPTPVRVAWDEQIKRDVGSRKSSTGSVKSRKSTKTLDDLTALHPQAYVPYNVAKRNINRVISDMNLMREDHRRALIEVNRIYKEIEIETQTTFTEFVTELRQDYKDKVKAFTHIIDICMKDNARKEEDWKLQAESLKDCNIKLVSEVNELIEYNQKQKDQLNKNNTREIAQLRQAMTEERRQLLLSLQAREETLRNQYESHIQRLEERNRRKIDILIKQHQSNIQLREGVFASQFDAQAKEKEGIEGKMAEMAESHILEMKAKADEEEQRMRELKEEERLRLEKLQKEKEDEINRISEERDKMEKEWLAERDLINEEFQTKIDGLNKTIEDSESQIKVHEDALAEYKTKVEEDMKEFEVQRKAEMERVKAAATEEEKKRIMEELEQNKRRTERKMRNSLANIQFHEAQKQTLLGKMDFAENQLREAEVEQEEAEAEVTHEKNRRLQEFKSEVEVKSAELEHIKSEHSAAVLESAEHKSTENPDLEQTVLTQSSPDNKISTDVETIKLRNKLERLTAELESAKEDAKLAREEVEQVKEENEKKLGDEKKNFEANIKSHETELQSKQDIIVELRKQVTDLEAKTLADLPPDAQETIQTYKEKLVKLEHEVESKDEMRNKLELSIELEKNKSVSLQESVDKLNQTLNDTNTKLTKVKEEKEKENKTLLIRCQEAEKSKRLVSANSSELIEFKNKVEQLQAELNSSRDEVKSVQEKMEKQKEESEKKLEDERKLTEANTKSHQAELQSKQDMIAELRSQISNLESEKLADLPTGAQQTIQEYRDRLCVLEQKVEENEAVKNQLELSVDLEKTKATSLQGNVDRLNQSVSDLNAQLSGIRYEKEKEAKILLLRCQNAEKNAQIASAPISSSASTNQVVIDLTNSVEQLKSELNSSKDEVKSVQEKIEKQKEESEKKLEDEKKLTEANTKSHQAELQNKQEVIAELRKQINDLEAKTLADLPSDAQETIQTYKSKLVALEQEIENVNEVKTKLELSIEVEKTKAASLLEDVNRLKQSLEDESKSKLTKVKEEKEEENKTLLIRCQEAEKSKLLAEEISNKELIELRNKLEQLQTELNSSKDEVKSVQEKMEKQKEESEKKLEDEKKLTEANTNSHQAELQGKQDMIAELKKQISELERRTLSELPPDAQQTIQSYKDRLESLEKKSEEAEETKTKLELAVELEKTKATSVQENNDRLNQTLADLNAKLESLKEEKEKEIKSLLTRCQEAEKSVQLEGSAISVAKIAIANAVPTGEKIAVPVQDTEQSTKLTTENKQLSEQLNKLKQDVGSRNKAINSLKLQLQEERTKSEAFEKHLKMVLTESCEDEKQRKHNNKRLTAKQTELDAIRQQRDELERELAEWKVKAESQEAFQSYVTSKEEELATLSSKEESFVKSVKALTLLYDGEISEDIIPASTSVLVGTVIDTDPVVIDTHVVDTTDTTAAGDTAADSSAPAAVTRTVVEVSGESGEMVQQLNDQVSSLTEEVESLTEERDTLTEEKEAAEKEVIELKNNVEQLTSELTNSKEEANAAREDVEQVKKESEKKLDDEKKLTEANTKSHQAELQNKLDIISDLRNQVTDLEAEKLANLPPDAQETIQTYRDRLTLLEQEVEGTDDMKNKLELAVELEKTKASSLKESNDRLNQSLADMNTKLTNLQKEKEKEVKALLTRCQESEKTKLLEEKSEASGDKNKIKQLNAETKKLNAKLSKLEEDVELKTQQLKDTKTALKEAKQEAKKGGGPGPGGPGKRGGKAGAGGGASDAQVKALKDKNNDLKKQVEDSDNAIADLKKKLRAAETEAKKAAEAVKNNKDTKKLELTKKVLDEAKLKIGKLEEIKTELEKENERSRKEIAELQGNVKNLSVAAEEGEKLAQQCEEMKGELKTIRSENAELVENYNSERILRKKYYNIIEDMKGKIRVYCRARPLSGSEKERGNHSVILSPDEYTVQVQTKRGVKEFAYDQVFTPDTRGAQEHVFEDVKMLIQSAVDGYNVCIFAYGQTGSGKTFTMIGDSSGKLPGIAPRAYDEIFSLLQANEKKFSFAVSVYMVELYNDQLLDLFDKSHSAKLDIKKDKKGMVVIQNAVIKDVKSVAELQEVFDLGSKNRHVASTKMNAESSRSHLVIGIVIETTNLTTGAVLRGKLSLVDLAGSERAAKTGATPEQLKEAQSINKSLSALGDVIQALSSEANFIPYRNNKLTMLMQDSLGGNAKTLMFVNISPADYNMDETVVSLTYASRVKLITNDASKNADNKEIARLKGIISKLKKGESLNEDDEV